MSDIDYQELLLYLEQTENEISRTLEMGARKFPSESPVKEENIEDEELEDLMLIQLEISSDISELLSKNNKKHNSITDYQFYNNINDDKYTCLNGHSIYEKHYENEKEFKENEFNGNGHHIEHDFLSDTLGSDSFANSILSDHNGINVVTQTSPSVSPSCTNLTWASECSSTPCLTSTSDSDLIEEDAQSTSSTDGRNNQQLTTSWGYKQQILSSKSSSAPVLKKSTKVSRQSRSQSDRHLAEIEAAEACKWLRATGFPQYAQMHEDSQFPIDIATAAQDHQFLEQDVLISLFRRLEILNSCAHLHQQRVSHATPDDSEDENCALSENWTYQKDIRRWSRTCKNIQIPKAEDTHQQLDNTSQEKDDVFEKTTETPKERLRRAGSTKFRRRREDVVISDKFLDSKLNDIKCEVNHVSDSEITPRHNRRSRTKSFDKTDTWSHPHSTTERTIFLKTPEHEICHPEKEITLDNSGPPIYSLSSSQLQVLKKLALLKLTAHMEKYCPSHRTGWNWDLPKFIRKIKSPVYKDKNIFGVPLSVTLQRTGQTLPRNIEDALQWLQQNAVDQVGIFRKPGVKSRIQALRNIVESSSGHVNFNDHQHYDVADMVKQYFRDLPEALLTNKLSETFILIFLHVPPHLRGESVLCALLLMPDEHIEVLQCLLQFLLTIAKHCNINQMNESNLAMCFAPSLFNYPQITKQNSGSPHPKELAENRAGHECLHYFLKNYNTLFKIPQEFMKQCKSSENSRAVKLSELGRQDGGWKCYLDVCQAQLLKEIKEKTRGWLIIQGHNPKVEISYKKVADGLPLRLWRVSAEIEAPPSEVLHRLLRERHVWDPDLDVARIISQIEKNTEVFQYVRRNIHPLPNKEYCVVRKWERDLPKDSCLIVETSIEHTDATPVPNTTRGIVLASRYFIEPCGSGKSRLVHLSRVDTMGRTPEWHHKNYGHICAIFVANIQNSFSQTTSGPESKV